MARIELVLDCADLERQNRFHLDVRVDDVEAEAARLVALGATRLRDEQFEELGERWITMADPEGNELCVCSC